MNLWRLALLCAIPAVSMGAVPAAQIDLLIRGGTVYTGPGAPFVGDVAVTGDRISAVGYTDTNEQRAFVVCDLELDLGELSAQGVERGRVPLDGFPNSTQRPCHIGPVGQHHRQPPIAFVAVPECIP